MNETETVLVHFAFILGEFGENSIQADSFQKKYDDDPLLRAELIKVKQLFLEEKYGG